MYIGLIPMFYFGILKNFEGNRKKEKDWKSGENWVPTPQHKEPTLQRRPTLRCGIPSLRRGRGAKMAPLRYAEAKAYAAA